jgi:hypothetical protein
MRPHELAALLSGFAGMGHVVPAEWLSDAMQIVAARSREFGPQVGGWPNPRKVAPCGTELRRRIEWKCA